MIWAPTPNLGQASTSATGLPMRRLHTFPIQAEGTKLVEPFRWRPSPSYCAHLYKAIARQHHRELIPLLRDMIPVDGVVFDIGAHAGQFAKLFSRMVPSGQVWSFEPGSYARSILRVALWWTACPNVSVVPMGLGSAPAVLSLNLPVKRKGSLGFGLAHLGPPDARWSRIEREAVAVTTIDSFVAALAIDRLDFIKADIEGWELQMIKGGIETLRRFRPRLLLEMDADHLLRAGDTLEGAFSEIMGLGYRPFVEQSGRLVPLEGPLSTDVWWLPEEVTAMA
jgi:FkbM family methyltransferase